MTVESLQKALDEVTPHCQSIIDFKKLFSVFQKTHDAWTHKVRDGILGLYHTADHLGHEDERNSCAYLLRDLFGDETEEGIFGELFLKEKTK